MKSTKKFSNQDFIKFEQLNILSNANIAILYASLMTNDDSDWTFDSHSHSFYELHICLNGNCDISMQNSHSIFLSTNKYILIHPNTYHKITDCSTDFFRLSIAFDIQHNNSIVSDENKYILDDCSENISMFLQRIFLEYNNHAWGYKQLIAFHIQTILIHLLREYPYIMHSPKNQYDATHTNLHNALKFIKNNISHKITVADVAKHTNLSQRQLDRIFTSALDTTVSTFLRTEKIYRVQEYLIKTNLTLSEIALLTGFNDTYALIKAFKRITGTTPHAYRLNHKE
ncbi:MAG: helix-turn-helix transcriptional regulator [Clostridia bacterium]|nr:helix-turn-helix transcriptional regulator [Clostridia bacterium]